MKGQHGTLLTLVAAAFLSIMASEAGAQTQDKGSHHLQSCSDWEQAEKLTVGSKAAMVCAKRKTVQITTEKKIFLDWFSPKTKHLFLGCRGYYTPRRNVHVCSKCGSDSIFCCSSSPLTRTPGM
jgi:hypothetical protein